MGQTTHGHSCCVKQPSGGRRDTSHKDVDIKQATYATFCQGPYEASARYRDFLGWEMPWYSAQGSLDTLLVGQVTSEV
jgi:predicted dithiol-disulfide oxidoreductase (DUF899 family)